MKGALLGAVVVLALVAHSTGANMLCQSFAHTLFTQLHQNWKAASDRAYGEEAKAECNCTTGPRHHQPAADAVILGCACDGRDPGRRGNAAPARDTFVAAAWADAGARAACCLNQRSKPARYLKHDGKGQACGNLEHLHVSCLSVMGH